MAEKYFIALLADDGVPGHAFVNFGRESDAQMSSITDGTFGMYPITKILGGLSVVIGEVPGIIKDDFLTNKDHRLVVEVSALEYQKCLSILQKWRSKNYQLLKSDCLSFVVEIADAIAAKISVPSRIGFDNFPAEWLKKLIQNN